MEITCSSCSKVTNIPDEKIPKGQPFSFTCPSCKTKVRVEPDAGASGGRTAGAGGGSPSGEMFGADSDMPGAMVCHTDPAAFKALFESMGYAVHSPTTHDEAINDLRINNYRLILVTDDFSSVPRGEVGFLEYLQGMAMSTRRKLFVIYVVRGAHSYDNMEAFALSVNLVVNPTDAAKDNFKDHVARGLKSNDALYKVYFDCMTAMGKM